MKKIIVLSFIFFTFISVTAQDLVSTVSVNSVTCNSACDGVITVNATGGTGGYQYELYDFSMVLIATSTSSVFTNLCAGSFSVYVKDSGNNEYVVNSVEVTEPSVLVSDILVTKEPTFGDNDGEITVNVTGGTPPYEYNISSMSSNQFLSSNVFSDLSAGNYTLFIKDQVGCILSQEITLENSIPDTDGDGVFDNVDLDDDNDGNRDGTDPNPLVPTVADDVLIVTEGIAGTVNVLSNDDFLPGATTSLSVVAGAGTTAGGTISFDPLRGEMSYTPLAGEEGTTVAVEYQVCNTAVAPPVCETAIVTITVQVDTDGDGDPDVTDPDDDNDGSPDDTDANPLVSTVADDVLTVTEGITGVVNILTNDDFLPGATTSLSVVAGVGTTAGGTISFDPLTGEMSYTSLASEEGTTVTVEYQVCNTAVSPAVCATSIVTITVQVDTDGDGIADVDDLDDDNDGIPDTAEGTGDTDGDGIPDSLDLDSDNDGVLDVDEGGNGDLDTNGDGVIDSNDSGFSDTNGDGQADGSVDTDEEPDTDGDGVPDYQDLDSDNDGINDVIEGGNEASDTNGDGVIDSNDTNGGDNDGDGISDSVDADDNNFGEGNGGEVNTVDTDGDGVSDYQDLDSDDDGVNDVEEGGNSDTDGDGQVDNSQADTDGDGIADSVDGLDGYGDANDPDNDSDPTDPDSGGNGVVGDSGADTDGDGIPDSVDGLDGFGDLISKGNKNSINGYPNPAVKEIKLPAKFEGKEFKILNTLGSVVDEGKVSNFQISIKNLGKGVYFLKIKEYKPFKFIKS